MQTGKSGAIRSSRVPAETVLVMSADQAIREGWARHFELLGLRVIRCAGPENTSCALERGPRCPLQDESDVAWYDIDSVTDELAVHLLMQRHGVPITFAQDRATSDGGHRPEPVHLMDPRLRPIPEATVR